jgi:hypothetical protein
MQTLSPKTTRSEDEFLMRRATTYKNGAESRVNDVAATHARPLVYRLFSVIGSNRRDLCEQ